MKQIITKPMTAYLALCFLASALPAAAQTLPTPDAAAPRPALSAAEVAKILARVNAIGLRRGSNAFDISPQEKARSSAILARINELTPAGTEALHLKNFAAAEVDYCELVQIDPDVNSYYGLGEALAGQGKTAEALAAYKTAVEWPLNTDPRAIAINQAHGNYNNLRGCAFSKDAVAWMKYALLLSQTGQNAQAFAVYSGAVHLAGDTAYPDLKPLSSTEQPSPVELQAAAHIALGLLVNGTSYDPEEAMNEFAQARALAPDVAVTNYYYGYGWQRLDRNSPTRAADAVQAKAALAKAAVSDDDTIKKAATEALKRMP